MKSLNLLFHILFMNLSLQNKKGTSLIEIIIVVWIILGLLSWLATSLWGVSSKQKDSWRVKLLQEYMTYYDGVKQSIWQYPGPGIKGTGAAKDKAKLVEQNAKYKFVNNIDTTTGLYPAEALNLPKLQSALVEAWVLPDPKSIKQGFADEEMYIFTSTSWKRAVGCMKMYWPTEAAQNDGDWLPDTAPADDPNASNNGNRIYTYWDMWLWKQLWATATDACKTLVDPKTL